MDGLRFTEGGEEAVRPVFGGVAADAGEQGLPAAEALFLGHGQGSVDHGSGALDIIRVDHEGVLHRLGGSTKAGEDKYARVGGLGGDKLLGYKVHAVPEGSDEAGVGFPVKVGEVLLGIGTVKGEDRHPVGLAEFAVNPADEGIQLGALLCVLGDVDAAGGGDLDEGDTASEVGVGVQKSLDGLHTLGDSLGVVKSVDAE